MLSAPVCGAEMRKAVVAPLPAPWRRSDVATGITLHEQSGSGTPKAEALSTDTHPRPPR